MYGGCSGFHRQETWEWDGTDWRRLYPKNSPPALCAYGLVTDLPRRRIVLFGGGNASGRKNQTWEWDGTNWAQRFPKNHGKTRAEAQLYRTLKSKIDTLSIYLPHIDGG